MTVRSRFLPATAIAMLAAAPGFAQSGVSTVPPPLAAVPLATDPVEALGRYLRVLAVFPRNLDALTGAGRSSLAIGDANAAISFFARAQEIAPGDGRIKAGLASALVQMEQPKTALKLFDQAVALGVPEAEIASDRGLARDLRGDTRRAQADYALALRTQPDDETTRRLAVSQAIGGDRAGAMGTLDALLRRQDRAAWRVRAFVLALTGDRDGAELAARNAMPLPQAQALMPFFARLPGLRPGEKAAAVHLGQFPSDGRSTGNQALFAQADNAAAPAPPLGRRSDVPLIPVGTPLGAAAFANASEALSRAPRRRPGAADAAEPAGAPAARIAAVTPPPTAYPPVATAAPVSGAARPPAAPVRTVLTVLPRPAAGASAPAADPPTGPRPPAPLIAVPARAAAIVTLPAMAPPIVARLVSAPPRAIVTLPAMAPPDVAQSVPARQVAIVTLPAMAPPILAQPTASPQPAAGRPAVQPVDIPASSVVSPAADAPVVATRFGPALAQPVAVANVPERLAAAEPPSPPPAATAERVAEPSPAGTPAPAGPAAKAIEPPVSGRHVRVNGKEQAEDEVPAARHGAKGNAADTKGAAAKQKPSADDARSAAAKERLAAKDGKEKAAKAKDTKVKDLAKAKEAAADKDEPAGGERYWVQVASGANKTDLGRAWEKTRLHAPKLLGGRTTWTSPWKASNRLLVGPFKTDEEAQEFVNTLGKAGMGSMQFTSRGKTRVERLSGN